MSLELRRNPPFCLPWTGEIAANYDAFITHDVLFRPQKLIAINHSIQVKNPEILKNPFPQRMGKNIKKYRTAIEYSRKENARPEAGHSVFR
jgi:hypothetical protein